MAGRIVVFGATGYTGRLTAQALLRRGARPVLAARSRTRLEQLRREMGGELEIAEADVVRPDTVRALLHGPGDVLVSTVGPFVRFGHPALEAALAARASYVDSTGEPAFIRDVFERYGPRAEAAGCGLVTAFGYDYVPGNLAGALALRDAGARARRVDIGYFTLGAGPSSLSGGTRASLAGALLRPGFAFSDGAVHEEWGGRHVRAFDVRDERRSAVSLGASEHYALPRLAPELREVRVHLGWFGPLARPLQAASLLSAGVARLPGATALLSAVTGRLVQGSTGGPDEATRARGSSHVVAVASDAGGTPLAEVHLDGPEPYGFTADLLAWGAQRAAEGGLTGTGALGPVDGFGLAALQEASAQAGLRRI